MSLGYSTQLYEGAEDGLIGTGEDMGETLRKVGTSRVMIVVAIALLSSSLFLPWYVFWLEDQGLRALVREEYNLGEVVVIQYQDGVATNRFTRTFLAWGTPEVGELMARIQIFALLSIVLLILFLVLSLKWRGPILLILGAAGGVFSLVATSYLFLGVEDALSKYRGFTGFWGSAIVEPNIQFGWGPAVGWIIALVATAAVFVALILSRRIVRRRGVE